MAEMKPNVHQLERETPYLTSLNSVASPTPKADDALTYYSLEQIVPICSHQTARPEKIRRFILAKSVERCNSLYRREHANS